MFFYLRSWRILDLLCTWLSHKYRTVLYCLSNIITLGEDIIWDSTIPWVICWISWGIFYSSSWLNHYNLPMFNTCHLLAYLVPYSLCFLPINLILCWTIFLWLCHQVSGFESATHFTIFIHLVHLLVISWNVLWQNLG